MYELKRLIKQGILLILAVVLARFSWQIVAPEFINLWTGSFAPWLSDTISATTYNLSHPAHPERIPILIGMMVIPGIMMLALVGWIIAEWISAELYIRKRRKRYNEMSVTQNEESEEKNPEAGTAE